jgi:hypothetical protein
MRNDNGDLICDDCGTDEGVEETICPYANEINNQIIDVDLCEECKQQRAEDI